jgi:MoxR-like ATPase
MPRLAEFQLQPVADLATLVAMRHVVQQIRASDEVLDYIVDLVRATRERPSIAFGASPRAATMLTIASRAYAALQGRDYVLPDDLKLLAVPALRHRIVLAPGAEIEGLTTEAVVRQILEQVPVPR